MNKKERRAEIKKEMQDLRTLIAFYRRQIDELKEEQDYMRGHYNQTWEERYALEKEGEQNA
jgi:hypothetical protein